MIYIIDTNVLVDYEDIIPTPSGNARALEAPSVDLNGTHLIIPTVVIRELSKFKGEKSERGKAARTILKRLRELFGENVPTMREAYALGAPIEVGGLTLSILPVHKDFSRQLPFHPADDDMDGQIILAALSAQYLIAGLSVDTKSTGANNSGRLLDASEKVILLTNDNGLAIRARTRGVRTSRFGYKLPAPYTGRRDIEVPAELYVEFVSGTQIEREWFEEMLPDEPKLVANEFIVMKSSGDLPLNYDPRDDSYFSYIGRYDATDGTICHLKHVRDFPVRPENPGQAIYAEALLSPEIAAVICTGPAGSGKTFMATVYGYVACKAGEFIGVTVVPCESRSKIGALPGDLDEKMDPDTQPLKNALRNYLLQEDASLRKELSVLKKYGTSSKNSKNGCKNANGCKSGEESSQEPSRRSIKTKLADRVNLIWENWFSNVPIENARGRDFAHELAIYDEFQDQNAVQADTLIKRLGADGKIVITGDTRQIHAAYLDQFNNGLVYASNLLFDNPMVAQVCFLEDEVIRHPLVKQIAKRQKK